MIHFYYFENAFAKNENFYSSNASTEHSTHIKDFLAPCCLIYRVTEEALAAVTAVWPIPFLINGSLLIQDLSFIFI